ncbi:heterokaryon incompatibility protein-domain-containing protein [Xylaria scruposa]|nr:heterokaryon incompatibility protein-domain-containing protein [Xylaria scruposa]
MGSYMDAMYEHKHVVSNIVEDLSRRDPRFNFIKESYHEFMTGQYGLDQNAGDSGEIQLFLLAGFYDIITSAIYEVLNVFNLEITFKDVPNLLNSNALVELLVSIYEKSKCLSPQPAKIRSINRAPQRSKDHQYQYPTQLNSSNVRVLSIQPGAEEGPIECKLYVRDINTDGIEAALSYAWGKGPLSDETITVDGSTFSVTKNLYGILHKLRLPDVPRDIWIDAICINQSDPEEKGHQVRLMGDIYSKATEVIIWLGDWPPKWMDLLLKQLDDQRDSFPRAFGGNLMDPYDLPSILNDFLKYKKEDQWDEKRCGLGIMLHRYLALVMSREWWERIWTIQEAALPLNEPTIYFRGFYYLYSTLISAMDVCPSEEDISNSNLFSPGTETLRSTMMVGILQRNSNIWSNLLIRHLRPEKAKEGNQPHKWRRITLIGLLSFATRYRATDRRDKIFALASLLSKSTGLLINVDYNESDQAVYRRITARGMNTTLGCNGAFHYNFIFESEGDLRDTQPGPSWVFDFTYSDVDEHFPLSRRPALLGFLNLKENFQPFWGGSQQQKTFATPKTLFSSGISIGVICHTKRSVAITRENHKTYDQLFESFIEESRQERDKMVTADKVLERKTEDVAANNVTVVEIDTAQSPGSDADITETESHIQWPTLEELVHTGTFGSVMWQWRLEPNVDDKFEEAFVLVFENISKTYLFAAMEGTIGVATAPVQRGDILAIVHAHCNYLILREVNDESSASQATKKHRIVASAAITRSQENIRDQTRNKDQECFQII